MFVELWEKKILAPLGAKPSVPLLTALTHPRAFIRQSAKRTTLDQTARSRRHPLSILDVLRRPGNRKLRLVFRRLIPTMSHLGDRISKQRVTDGQRDEKSDDEDDGGHRAWFPRTAVLKKSPSAKIEGTHNPTNMPASRFSFPKAPNQSETEKRNDTNAAPKII
jgi:hypothetical protein